MKKRNLILAVFVMVMFMAAVLPLAAASADDYKVVKKALKNKKAGEASWFRVEVIETGKDESKVKIRLPLSLVEVMMDAAGAVNLEEKLKGKVDLGKLDLKKMLNELKNHGPFTMVEITEKDTQIKVWLE